MQPHSAPRQEEIRSGYLTEESIHDLLDMKPKIIAALLYTSRSKIPTHLLH